MRPQRPPVAPLEIIGVQRGENVRLLNTYLRAPCLPMILLGALVHCKEGSVKSILYLSYNSQMSLTIENCLGKEE